MISRKPTDMRSVALFVIGLFFAMLGILYWHWNSSAYNTKSQPGGVVPASEQFSELVERGWPAKSATPLNPPQNDGAVNTTPPVDTPAD